MPDQDPPNSLFAPNEKIEGINVADEIKNSFLDYSMSVIVSRALPDVRDGLKPSQRRILLAMHDLNLYPGRPYRKCAKICGDTSGNYHPHGEAIVYPTLVHMAQPWAMRDPLIDGQGNFGSVEGDPPAAMRYTEARLTHLGGLLMQDMEKETVDMKKSYDEKLDEPVVFPAAFPNLLVNGGTGIAVGMATNLPPHNLGEVVDGICRVIDEPDVSHDDLGKIIKGPDFPTGCTILGYEGVRKYQRTGRGSVKMRGRIHIEEVRGGKENIVITEIPFNVNRDDLIRQIADLVNDKVITEITNVRNESTKSTRVVLEIKRDAIPKIVINNLYKLTALESSFSVNMLAIDNGLPRTLNVKDCINCYVEHRRDVVLRRTRFELKQALARAETLEAFLIALANLDDFIRIIRESSSREEAREGLAAYRFSEQSVRAWGINVRDEARLINGAYLLTPGQIDSVLEMRLYQLVGLERDKILNEYTELNVRIDDLYDILAREDRVLTIIKNELLAIKEKHGTKRRTDIVPDEGEMNIEDLIADEQVVITITHNSLIKRTNSSAYRAQRRGGKGVIGMTTREGDKPEDTDFIEHMFTAGTHDYLMFFTNTGRAYVERVHEIPDLGRASKGRSIANVANLREGEKVAALIPIQSRRNVANEDVTWQTGEFLFFATENGTVKKTALADFSNLRTGGIIAINIEENDRLIEVRLTSGQSEPVLITKKGMSIRFDESDVRSMGRATTGVRGISLEDGDKVVALALVDTNATLLVVGEQGIGKRTPFDEYRKQTRGGKGIITMKTTEKTGDVVGALTVVDSDEIMVITTQGQMVRTPVKDIRETGRNTMGVKIVELNNGDTVSAITPAKAEPSEEGPPTSETTGELPS
ncbi:DNA gyrase subunit A [Verrucomicrobia bacterium LW23]|nr:DNA gyrase subunit A [Verrucomicrobia bacterium LW23]